MAGIRIEGNTSGNVAEVDANNLIRITGANSGTFDETTAGKFMVVDASGDPLEFDHEGSVRVSPHHLLFHEPADGTQVVPDLRLWSWAGTTMTVAQNSAPSRITMNAGAITTINTNITLSSLMNFVTYRNGAVNAYLRIKPTALPNTNAQAEIGFMAVAGAATPTDGAYFRWKPNNTFVCVICSNGVETESAAQTAPTVGEYLQIEIYWDGEKAKFEWQAPAGTKLSVTLSTGVATVGLTNTVRLPLATRIMIGASAPGAAPQLDFGEMAVLQNTFTLNESYRDMLVTSLGRGSFQSPTTPYAQTANHANSTSPTSATLSNTAAGYTTLGGRFQFAAVAGAATDFALFGFQVPAGYKFCCTGVAISCVNTVVAVATTATILDWSLGLNSSAVSLATADSVPGAGPVAVAPRRVSLGTQSFIVGAAVGAVAESIVRNFEQPYVVEPGRFFHVIMQVPVGTATATEVFRGDVMVQGYFE